MLSLAQSTAAQRPNPEQGKRDEARVESFV